MHCSNCGAHIDPSARHCSQCGAAVRLSTQPQPQPPIPFRNSGFKECPRCGYRGEGVGYFNRPSHMAILVGLSAITYLIGGAAYWIARRKHKVCPNCGFKWELARFYTPEDGTGVPQVRGSEEDVKHLPRSGIGRRVLGALLASVGVIGIMIGIAEGEVEAIMGGMTFGFMGSASFWWGYAALQGRRRAIDRQLERRVLQLAHLRGGTLTVTEVAAHLDLSLPSAERILLTMDDGFRIRSDVTNDGLIVYEFPEVRHMRSLESGSEPTNS